MAAEKSNENLVTVMVQSLAGEIFEVQVNPRHGVKAVKDFLYQHYPNAFSPSSDMEMDVVNATGKKPYPIRNGETLFAIVAPNKYVRLANCEPYNDDTMRNCIIYTFMVKREGVRVYDMYHPHIPSGDGFYAPKYTKQEIKAYLEDDTKNPEFMFMMYYNPKHPNEYIAMGHRNPHINSHHRGPNQTYVDFFKKSGFHFMYYRDEEEQLGFSEVNFSFKADAARELAKLLESYQFKCPSPFNANTNANNVTNAIRAMKITNAQQQGGIFLKKKSTKKAKKSKKSTRRKHYHK